jgi:hypothetical protein
MECSVHSFPPWVASSRIDTVSQCCKDKENPSTATPPDVMEEDDDDEEEEEYESQQPEPDNDDNEQQQQSAGIDSSQVETETDGASASASATQSMIARRNNHKLTSPGGVAPRCE